MALPTYFLEANDTHTGPDGIRYAVLIRDTHLGKEKTTEVISGWQLSSRELAVVIENEGVVFLSIIGGQPPCEIIGGDPVEFEGQNAVYTHPDCRDLPVYKGKILYKGNHTIKVTSAWQLSDDQLHKTIENGGVVFLRIVGGQPPCEVDGINPIRS